METQQTQHWQRQLLLLLRRYQQQSWPHWHCKILYDALLSVCVCARSFLSWSSCNPDIQGRTSGKLVQSTGIRIILEHILYCQLAFPMTFKALFPFVQYFCHPNSLKKCLFPSSEMKNPEDFFFHIREKCFQGRDFAPEGWLYCSERSEGCNFWCSMGLSFFLYRVPFTFACS